MMAKAGDQKDVLYYVGNRSPRISRSLSTISGSFALPPGTTYRIKARSTESSTVLLDKPMVIDDDNDAIYYDPASTDTIFQAQGLYRAWVELTVATGIKQDVDEFNLVVLAHSPGLGVRTGAIARRARRKAPVAWDALHDYREFGDPGLQDLVELTKLRTLPAGMTITAEQEDLLDLRVCNYLSLLVAIEVLKAAMDYWSSRAVGENLASPGEATTYPDRIAAAKELIKILEGDVAQAQAEAEAVLGVGLGTVTAGGLSMIGGSLPITPGVDGYCGEETGYGSALWNGYDS